MQELYKGLTDGRFTNDREAAIAIYNTSADDPNYKKLKNRLHNRLINTSFFIDVDQKNMSDYFREYYQCRKNVLATATLGMRGAIRAAIDLGTKTLNKSLRYEFSDLIIELCINLIQFRAVITTKEKDYEHLFELKQKYEQIRYIESIAMGFNSRLAYFQRTEKKDKEELAQMANEFINELNQYREECGTYNFFRYYHYINLRRFVIINDFENLYHACKIAVKDFKTKSFFKYSMVGPILIRKAQACLQLKKYQEGISAADIVIDNDFLSIINVFAGLQLKTNILFHSERYQEAYEVIAQAKSHPRFNSIAQLSKETWGLFEAYANLFINMNLIDPHKSKHQLKKFRLKRFLNSSLEHSASKRDKNIPILIIQILFLLQAKEYEELENKLSSLKIYSYRYLKHNNTFRSNCFIKMLLQLPIGRFHKAAVIRKTEKLKIRLENTPPELIRQSAETEIIPYETLWDHVLSLLNYKFY